MLHAESEPINEKVSDEAETAAAIKIQAAYRGHKVRMDLRKPDDNTTNLLPESEAELEGKFKICFPRILTCNPFFFRTRENIAVTFPGWDKTDLWLHLFLSSWFT